MTISKIDNDLIYRNNWFLNGNLRKINDDTYICISNSARWMFLKTEEVVMLKSVRLNKKLFSKLEKKGLIITKENASKIFDYYLLWNEKKYGNASLHIIETTSNCNLSCAYCHVSASSISLDNRRFNNLKTVTANKIIDFIFTSPSEKIHIEFQGGESLLNFEIVKHIVNRVKKINHKFKKTLDFSIVTNLISLSKEHCDFLKQHKIGYTTTIDGPQFIHDENRPNHTGGGSFNNIMRSLKLLDELKMPLPGVLTVITKNSINHIRQLIEMYDDIGLNKIGLIFVSSLGIAINNWNNIGISINDEINAYKQVIDLIIEKWRSGRFISERLFNLALYKILSVKDTLYMDFRNPCGIGKGQIAYNINGEIYGCDEGRSYDKFKIGNVNDSNYKSTISNPHVDELISESLPNYAECKTCAYESLCGLCPVQAHADEINIRTSKNDNHCHFTQFIFDYCFKLMNDEPELMKSYIAYNDMLESGALKAKLHNAKLKE